MRFYRGILTSIFVLLWVFPTIGQQVRVTGEQSVWKPLAMEIAGPQCTEEGESNPFLDYRVSVEFRRDDEVHRIPAYFAADGNAAESSATKGNVWRAHFVPPTSGQWKYRVDFQHGDKIAIGNQDGETVACHGQSGYVAIGSDNGDPGPLRYVGQRYLQHAGNGKFFLKSGADSPENFLAYAEFDGTWRASDESAKQGEAEGGALHRYEPHLRDWNQGDPVWKGDRGKSLIGALNYLASQGVNSVYFLTMNVRGDGKDVWPWTSPEERFRFDCSKLDQWEIAFSHMDRLGLALHVVLTETENESLLEHEEQKDFADSRKLYYRELVARFGHHRGVVWNLGEENGWDDRKSKDAMDEHWRTANTTQQRKAFARYLRTVDPYDHPIVVHTLPGRYEEIYRPILGDESFDGLSLQVQLGPRIHEETKKWIGASRNAGRQWFANLDEIGPASDGVKPDQDDPDHDDVRRFALWGNLMAGGSGCEWYFGYKYAHNDLNLEDFRSRQAMWKQTHLAVDFFQQHLPFWEMVSADELCSSSDLYCFAKPDEIYAIYLPAGQTGTIKLPDSTFDLQWYNPREGGPLQRGSVESVDGGAAVSVGSPPAQPDRDWVALLRRR